MSVVHAVAEGFRDAFKDQKPSELKTLASHYASFSTLPTSTRFGTKYQYRFTFSMFASKSTAKLEIDVADINEMLTTYECDLNDPDRLQELISLFRREYYSSVL